jgi:hypothetical protein
MAILKEIFDYSAPESVKMLLQPYTSVKIGFNNFNFRMNLIMAERQEKNMSTHQGFRKPLPYSFASIALIELCQTQTDPSCDYPDLVLDIYYADNERPNRVRG